MRGNEDEQLTGFLVVKSWNHLLFADDSAVRPQSEIGATAIFEFTEK